MALIIEDGATTLIPGNSAKTYEYFTHHARDIAELEDILASTTLDDTHQKKERKVTPNRDQSLYPAAKGKPGRPEKSSVSAAPYHSSRAVDGVVVHTDREGLDRVNRVFRDCKLVRKNKPFNKAHLTRMINHVEQDAEAEKYNEKRSGQGLIPVKPPRDFSSTEDIFELLNDAGIVVNSCDEEKMMTSKSAAYAPFYERFCDDYEKMNERDLSELQKKLEQMREEAE